MRRSGRVFVYPVSILATVSTLPIPLKSYYGFLGIEWFLGIGICLGYEMGKYVEPDWDIMGASSSEGRFVNDLPVLGHVLFGVSSMYGSIFRKHHRSFWTHFPFVSTGIRYILLFWWVWYQMYWSTWDLAWMIFLFIGMYIGTSLSDWVHYWADLHYKK